MTARELVSDSIPPLKTSDTGLDVLRWMNEFQVKHLPIVNNVQFLGLISEEDVLNVNDPTEPIGNYHLTYYRPFVKEEDHIFNVLKVMAQLKLSIVPVVDEQEKYCGLVTLQELLERFAHFASVDEAGGILVLELNVNDYSLSEIARIVESNDAIILGLFTKQSSDTTKLEITLKINKLDLKHIVATFDRYEYVILGYYHKSEQTEDLKDRYDLLIKYLNI